MNEILEPGMIVRHPGAPEWGTARSSRVSGIVSP